MARNRKPFRHLFVVLASLWVLAVSAGAPQWTSGQPLVRLEPQAQIGGPLDAIAVEGDLAFIGPGTTLTVVDLSDASSPHQVGAILLPDHAHDIAIDSDHAYVAAGAAGLLIYDLSDPLRPVKVGAFVTGAPALRVAVSGGLAYVAEYDRGTSNLGPWRVSLFDVSDPAEPRAVGELSQPGYLGDIHLEGDRLYVTGSWNGETLYVLDVADPTAPTVLGTVRFSDCIGGCESYLAVTGSDVIVSTSRRLLVADVSDPARPRIRGQAHWPDAGSGVTVRGRAVIISGDHALVLCRSIGLCVYDLTDPDRPSLVGQDETIWGEAAVLRGDHLVAVDQGALHVADVSRPVAPRRVGGLRPIGRLGGGMLRRGDHLYLGSWGDLRVFDLAEDPILPRQIAHVPVEGAVDARISAMVGTLASSGEILFASRDMTFYAELAALDVSDASRPRHLGSVTLAGNVSNLALWRDRAYAYVWPEGPGPEPRTQILDVADPAAMRVLGSLEPAGPVTGVGPYLYHIVSGGIDVLEPDGPTAHIRVGRLELPGIGSSLLLAGDLAFAIAGDDEARGLFVLDVSDPAHPTVAGTLPGLLLPPLAVAGHHVLLAWYDSGITVVDVSDPSTPREVKEAAWPPDLGLEPWEPYERLYSGAIVTNGDLAYVDASSAGLRVLRLHGAGEPPTPRPTRTGMATPKATATAPRESPTPIGGGTPSPLRFSAYVPFASKGADAP